MSSESATARTLLMAACVVGGLVIASCAKLEIKGSSGDERSGLRCPTAADVSDAIGMQVSTVPFKSIPPLEVCDFGGAGARPDSFDSGAPRVQLSTAPLDSSVWRLLPLQQDMDAGRVRAFPQLGANVMGGQYVESGDAAIWIDDPGGRIRYQLVISYRGVGELRDSSRALVDLRNVGALIGLRF